MLLVDTNVLIYAVHEGVRQHEAAHGWLVDALAGPEVVGFPWQSLTGFIRISTNPRVFAQPLPCEVAMDAVEGWLASRWATTPEPGARHAQVLRELLTDTGTAGNLTSEAHLAAMAREHGGAVVTFDRDLARFGVRVVVPGQD